MVKGTLNKILGEGNVAKGDRNKANGVRNIIQGKENNIDGHENSISGDINNINGDKNSAKGNSNYLEGQENIAQGDKNKVKGKKNTLSGSGNTIVKGISIEAYDSAVLKADNYFCRLQLRRFRVDAEVKINEVRTFVAKYVNANKNNVFLVENASDGFNGFMKSIKWKEGDVVAMPNTSYAMVKRTIDYLIDKYKIKILSGLAREYFWTGTRDFSSYCAIPAGINYYESFGKGAVREYNHNLTIQAGKLIASIWKTKLLTDDERLIGYLNNIQVPSNDIQRMVVSLHNVGAPGDLLQQKFELVMKNLTNLKRNSMEKVEDCTYFVCKDWRLVRNNEGTIVAFDSAISCMQLTDDLLIVGSFEGEVCLFDRASMLCLERIFTSIAIRSIPSTRNG
ncbi:unnamed protein product [Sphagnum balticum]